MPHDGKRPARASLLLRGRPAQLVDHVLVGRLPVAGQLDDRVPTGDVRALACVDAARHAPVLVRHRLGTRHFRVARQVEPELAVVAAPQLAAHRGAAGGIGGEDLHPGYASQVLHVDRERLRRGPVRLAHPKCLRIAVDRQQRAVVDGRVAGQGAGRQLPGRHGPLEHPGVRARFAQARLHLVAAVGRHLDDHLVRLVRQVAIGVLDAQVNEVAGLDLVGGSPLGEAEVPLFLFPRFARQPLAERLLLQVHDLAAGHLELGVGGHLNVDVGQRHRAELRLELVRVVAADDVAAGELEHVVAGHGAAQARVQVATEQTAPGAGAGQIDLLAVAARLGPDRHRDAVVAAADAQVAVVDDDRQRRPGRMMALAGAAQAAHRAQQPELVEVSLLDAVDLGQVEQGLVGQVDVRHAVQDAAEDVAGLVVVSPAQGQHAAQELGTNHDLGLPPGGQLLEHRFRLVVDPLRHERLADAELRFDGLRAIGVAVDDAGKLAPGHVVALRLEVVAGQQQLDLRLGGLVELLRGAVPDQPGAEGLLDAVVVLVAPGGDQLLANEDEKIGRHLRAVLVEQPLVGQVRLEGQTLVAKPQVERRPQ